MPYVSRNDQAGINGVYANLQPGYAEEFLPDDDPEVVAFLNPAPAPPNRLRALEGQPPLTLGDFVNQFATVTN
jgi:hypothetical protein